MPDVDDRKTKPIRASNEPAFVKYPLSDVVKSKFKSYDKDLDFTDCTRLATILSKHWTTLRSSPVSILRALLVDGAQR